MNTKAYYAKKAKYYDIINAHKYREADGEVRFFREKLRKFNRGAKTILDVGCGTGRLSVPLSRMGFKVLGIDNSKEMLAIAKKKSNRNLRFELADLRTYKSTEKFDCAICGDASLATFMSRSTLVKALRGICRNLKDEGVFFYDVWNYAEYNNWMPVSSRTEKRKDGEITLIRKTNVDPNGIYKFSDTISVKTGIKSYVLKMTYTSKVWRYREWSKIFREAGFRTVKCYSGLKHIRHFKGVPDRLYFMALK